MPNHHSTEQTQYYPQSPEVLEVLASGHGPGVFVPFRLLEITRDPATALIFSQMLYWASKMKFQWFYKSDQDWCDELHLSRNVVRRVIHGDSRSANGGITLQDLGVEIEVRQANGAPTKHYRINFDVLAKHLETPPLSAMQTNDCVQCRQSITEDYTEDTIHSTETADAPLFSEPQAPTIQQKPTHKAMVGALLEAMGITTPTKADWGQAGRVAKELMAAELELSDAYGLVQHVRTEAAGKWRVTLNSLITKGRVSDYLTKRVQDYTIVESEPTAPLNMDEFLVDFGDEDVNSQ